MDSFSEQRERKRLEQLHQLLTPQLDDYLMDGFEGVALHSAGTIIAVDRGAAAIFGYSPEELLYQNAMLFFPSSSAKLVMQQLLSQSTEPYTVTGIHKDGSEFQVQLRGEDFEAYGEPVRAVQLRLVHDNS